MQRTVLLHDARRASPQTRGTTMSTAARSLLHYQIDLLDNPAIDDVVVMSVVLDEVKNKNIPCTTKQDWGYGDGIPEDWGSSGGGSRSGCGGGRGHGGEKRSSMSA